MPDYDCSPHRRLVLLCLAAALVSGCETGIHPLPGPTHDLAAPLESADLALLADMADLTDVADLGLQNEHDLALADLAMADMADPLFQAGLPCDVASVLSVCLNCHTRPPRNGAPLPLVTRDDFAAPAGKVTAADRALARITDVNAPMPPEPFMRLTMDQIATVRAWVMAGLPRAECAPGDR